MMKAWITRETPTLHRRYPRLAARLLPTYERLSTASYALAIALIFGVLSAVTLFAVEMENYALWLGTLAAFFIHLLLHIAQTLVYRRYTPVIITSVLSCFYCVYAFLTVYQRTGPAWLALGMWTLAGILLIVVLLPLGMALGNRFQRFLDRF